MSKETAVEQDSKLQMKKVEDTIRTFLKGFDELEPTIISEAWHEKGTLQFIGKNGFQIVPLDQFCDHVRSIKADPNHPAHKEKGKKTFVDIDVCGTAARAKVLWQFPDFAFTDYYSLLKIDGRWQIVTKIWHRETPGS